MKIILTLSILAIPCLVFAKTQEPAQIRNVIQKNLKDVQQCYEAELKGNSELKGKVIINWDVNDQGIVSKAEVDKEKTTLKSNEALACIVEKLRSWTFPKASVGESYSVSYPFVFSNNKETAQ